MTIEAYVPPAVVISDITNSEVAVITTATPHGYSPGIYCTIVIPYPNVMEEINGKTYMMFPFSPTELLVIEEFIQGPISSLKFLDTTNMTPFVAAPLVRCLQVQPQTPLPRPFPVPPPPVVPPVVFFTPGQQAQLVPSGEIATTLRNASDVIGPRNLP